MKNRKAIIFFLAWSAVFAFALVFLSLGPQPAKAPREAFSSLDAERLCGIEIERRGQDAAPERVTLARSSGKWRLESPIAAEADEAAARGIIDAIVFAEPIDELSEPDMTAMGRTLRDFGLAVPQCTVLLRDGDAHEIYSFGRVTAAGDEVYVRRGEVGGIFTVPVRLLRGLMRPVGELRRRKLFSFRKADVVGIGLKKAGEPFSKLALSDGSWRITEPMDAPADRKVVDELVSALCSTSVVDYASGVAANSGLGEDEGYSLTLLDSFGSVEKVVFGAASGTNLVWVLTPEGAAARIDAALCEFCKRYQKELEDTRAFPVDAQSVTSVTVSKGFPAYVIAREGTVWRLVSPVDAPADPVVAERLLARVLAVRGADLVQDGSTGHVSVAVGTVSTNFSPRAVIDGFLPKDARLADMRDKLLLKSPRAQVRRIKVRTAAGVEWDATKSEEMLKLIEEGIVAEGVETVIFQPGDFARYGFDRPSFTVTCELDDKASPLRKFLLGAAAPGGGRYATIGGSEAAFILSAATVSSLTRPVADTPKAE